MSSDPLVMETVVSSTSLGHVGRVIQRSIGRIPFQHVTLRARTDGLEFFHDDGVVRTFARLDAEVDLTDEVLVSLRARVLVDLLQRLPRGRVALKCRSGELEVATSTGLYKLVAEPSARVPPELPTDGVKVDDAEYLDAFRRVVRASDRSSLDVALVRIAPHGSDLRLDCHGFDCSASDLLPSRAGTFGDGAAVIELEALAAVLSRFNGHNGVLTVTRTSAPDGIWFTGRRRNSPVSVAAGTTLFAGPALDATELIAQPRSNTLTIDGRVLRGALKRSLLVQQWGSHFVSIRLAERDSCELLTQGDRASLAEIVPCAFDGSPIELTLRLGDLFAIVARIKGPVVIAFADNRHSVLIGDGKHFRCFVRPLPPAADDGPQFRTQPQLIPFPVRGS